MQGALLILGFTVLLGVILYVAELCWRRRHSNAPSDEDSTEGVSADMPGNVSPNILADAQTSVGSECCGLHLVCDKDSLSPVSSEPIYYDDEELDRFAGRNQYTYTREEEEEFRDVLMTLRPEDVAGWARSITLRGINLPDNVRDELLMLVNEQRAMRKKTPAN
ncbi:MAG: phospholipase [Candidatus Amulumruptor caecigallinarius]|nr:phospholipase [Candidatus Amulumruptor caecigallinarius]